MTRVSIASKLLAHGPLTFREFLEITGWPYKTARQTISWLQITGRITFDGAWRLSK